jgi:hypothetical protein
MKKTRTALCALVMSATGLFAEDMPQMPEPAPQHEWLKKFAGEWNVVSEIHMTPGEEPVRGTGSESARMLGGFWVVANGSFEMPGMSMSSMLSFGYDPEKKEYVGTWIDSMSSQRWDYVGSVDESGKILTLTTRGFCPMEGKVCDFKSTVEFKSADQRVFTEKKRSQDGSWVTAVVSTYTRKK